jgi:hypothetical protein
MEDFKNREVPGSKGSENVLRWYRCTEHYVT